MALDGPHTYVGFGFGAIQSGLLLHEAFRSGSYRRLVVGEVVPQGVEDLRRAGGRFTVNIAHPDRVERAETGPVEIENPAVEKDREVLIEAIVEAEAIGTAVPSVAFYASDGPGSLHRVLAEGLRRKASRQGPRAVVYTAENNNHAAEILEEKVREVVPAGERGAVFARVRILNTVIGKMSGIVPDAASLKAWGLAPVTPGSPRAFLVEAFNRILITKIGFGGPPFERGIRVFEEKPDLLPFEEAKLYGHNATHALAAYVGAVRGVAQISDLRDLPGGMPFLRAAFLEESGEALVRKHGGVDPLFTREGYARYADDLLERMTNPHLRDSVERVGRDPDRKLGWDDRLIGTMRVALKQGGKPRRYAFGAAAALSVMGKGCEALEPLWGASADKAEREAVIGLIAAARPLLARWREGNFPDLEGIFRGS